MDLLQLLLPELILTATGCVLMLLGISGRLAVRRIVPVIALMALVVVTGIMPSLKNGIDSAGSIRIESLTGYVRLMAGGMAFLLLLLAWPTNPSATGNPGLNFGKDAGEFYGLMLFSVSGLMLTACANDLVMLFLALEMVSIPTYIMVTISRHRSSAYEAGLKYFFLGAMSAALMLFGFAYLYGTTGHIRLDAISRVLADSVGADSIAILSDWQKLGLLFVILAFAFKMAAVPLHFYAGDVYEGAATPVTAFLAFVPKAAGFVALIRILGVVGGPAWAIPPQILTLLWIMAVLTMTVGNVLGLMQQNVKRTLAYSSIAHSGYMLVGLAALGASQGEYRQEALAGVLFYLVGYGLMNSGAFGVLMLLPGRDDTSAQTFDDLAGQGKRHVALGLAMAVCCFGLIGLPATVGFWGKLMLLKPAFQAGMYWLVIITVVNAAISAAYYLRIAGSLFLRPESGQPLQPAPDPEANWPISTAVALSVCGVLLLGSLPGTSQFLAERAFLAVQYSPVADAGQTQGYVQIRNNTPSPVTGQ